jgi:hypothetical protein
MKDSMTAPHILPPFGPVTRVVPRPEALWGRRRFLGACAMAGVAGVLRAQAPGQGNAEFRGGKVEWARLRNSGQYWNRHAEADPELLDFIRRNSSLNIDTTWRAASGQALADLCNYPFLFADRVQNLNPTEGKNLAEYLKRGGFLFIDCCCNTGINPSPDDYLADQIKYLHGILPDIRIELMPETHDVYTLFFKMQRRPPRAMPGNSWMDTRIFPLRSLFLGKRLIGMLSMSGLQCAWAHVGSPANAQEGLQMMTNIYIYAITH